MSDVLRYLWNRDYPERSFDLIHVKGTNGQPYEFGQGEGNGIRSIEIDSFYIATVTITQGFWKFIMGDNPAEHRGDNLPLENVSWNELIGPDGFFERLNLSEIREGLAKQAAMDDAFFRLPTESEWEYAARGGPHWRDGFRLSGSDDADVVAWHHRKHGDWTMEVAQKKPNQLGIFDMSGNVWEWCQDAFVRDIQLIPEDGSAVTSSSEDRVLRGGCFHNGAEHCTASKRYEIDRKYSDGCIGFRPVFAAR